MQEQLKLDDVVIQQVPTMEIPEYRCLPFPNGFKPNIILESTLEKLARNIYKIPADKLDEFLDQYLS